MKLYEDGEDINLNQFISKEDISSVKQAKKELNAPDTLKAYFDHFEQVLDYNTIKIALTVIDTLDT